MHLYIETKKPEVGIQLFRKWFVRRCKLLIDIKTCKKTKMIYWTKEDQNAITHNIDGERLHDDWQMWQGSKAMGPKLDLYMYIARKWKSKYKMQKFIDCRDKYSSQKHREEILGKISVTANPKLLSQMTTTKNKGIYIWGSPKRGKTNTVYKRRTLWNATIQSNHSQKQNKTDTFCINI